MAQAWFRYYRETITDPKFTRLTAGQRHLWTVLLCLSDDEGQVKIADGVPYTSDELGALADITSDEARAAIEWLERVKSITIDDDVIVINNWSKRQFKSDNSTERVKQHRMKQQCNVSETCSETETETETDTEHREEGANAPPPTGRKNFVPPTAAEVAEYVAEKNLAVNADRFVDFYTAKGWMVGKNKMKDWRAAVRNWASRDTTGKVNPASTHSTPDDPVWMYETYRRVDYDRHQSEADWEVYVAFAAEFEPREAPTFSEWRSSQ